MIKKTVLEIYALAVCFVIVICITIAGGTGIYKMVGFLNPEFTIPSFEITKHATNDNYWKAISVDYDCDKGTVRKDMQKPNEETLAKQRQESYAIALNNEKRDSAQEIVKTIIFLFVCILIFIPHWYLGRKERTANKSNN